MERRYYVKPRSEDGDCSNEEIRGRMAAPDVRYSNGTVKSLLGRNAGIWLWHRRETAKRVLRPLGRTNAVKAKQPDLPPFSMSAAEYGRA